MKRLYISEEHLSEVYNKLKRYRKRMNDYPGTLHALMYSRKASLFNWATPGNVTKQIPMHENCFLAANSVPEMVDLRKVLKCFTAIKLRQGYKLDYVATAGENFMPVHPYVLRNDEKDFESFEDFEAHMDRTGIYDWKNELAMFIDVQKEPEGYFDVALLYACIRNLYLYQHANYSHLNLLYCKEAVEDFINGEYTEYGDTYSEKEYKKIRNLDIKPYVEEDNKGNIVVAFYAESPWGGVFLHKTKFSRRGPIIEYKRTMHGRAVIPHDCGIMF